jgi:hypothetical protein
METLKQEVHVVKVVWALNEINFNPRILYPAKLSFKRWSNKILPWQVETKTIYDHQATTTKDSSRNSAHRKWKQTKPQEDGQYRNTEDKTRNQRVALIQLHTIKPLNKKTQLNGRNHHIPININTECQWTQLPYQKILFGKLASGSSFLENSITASIIFLVIYLLMWLFPVDSVL